MLLIGLIGSLENLVPPYYNITTHTASYIPPGAPVPTKYGRISDSLYISYSGGLYYMPTGSIVLVAFISLRLNTGIWITQNRKRSKLLVLPC